MSAENKQSGIKYITLDDFIRQTCQKALPHTKGPDHEKKVESLKDTLCGESMILYLWKHITSDYYSPTPRADFQAYLDKRMHLLGICCYCFFTFQKPKTEQIIPEFFVKYAEEMMIVKLGAVRAVT